MRKEEWGHFQRIIPTNYGLLRGVARIGPPPWLTIIFCLAKINFNITIGIIIGYIHVSSFQNMNISE